VLIETERLILREMTNDDYDALYAVLADPDNMKYYAHAFDENVVRAWLTRNMERYKTFGFGLWAVVLKETGEMIGDCGLTMQFINNQIKPEIGYHIRRDCHRKGYASEAAIAVRDWTFTNTTFNLIYSYMMSSNIPSSKTAIAYGCELVEEYEDQINGKIKVFAISRDKWKKLIYQSNSQDKK